MIKSSPEIFFTSSCIKLFLQFLSVIAVSIVKKTFFYRTTLVAPSESIDFPYNFPHLYVTQLHYHSPQLFSPTEKAFF